ncbi:MAG: V-type ATP synthase subunit F [Oscillospiraceae bacterium]|nr:V-type ATP synthase subunit F [Oscillospiraceae bacterium]
MKFFCISDNIDTQIGMRLAGIEGVVVHTSEEVEEALNKACNDEEIGLVLVSNKLMNLCPDKIYDIKLRSKYPLVVEIPDRHGDVKISETITEYVRESIGVKI